MAQDGGAAAQGVTEIEQAATQAVMSEASLDTAEMVRVAAAGFTVPETVDITVDLDQEVAGVDLWPNATGTFRVQGTRSALTEAGATYDLTVTTVGPVVYTDPVTAVQATVPDGESFSYRLDVSWTYTDAANWTLDATGQMDAEDLEVIVAAPGAASVSAALTVQSQSSASILMAAGVPSGAGDVVGTWTATWTTEDEGSHEVVVSAEEGDVWTVTVDGTEYGPYTAEEFAAAVGAAVDEAGSTQYETGAAGAAVNTLTEVQDLLTQAVEDETETGSVPSRTAGRAAASFGVSADVVLPQSIQKTVDLSELSPDATGTVSLNLAGTIEDGSVVYTGSATCDTDVTYTDPGGAFGGTIPQGEVLPVRLEFAWAFQDRDNWRLETRNTVTTDEDGLAMAVTYQDQDGQPAAEDVTVNADLTVSGWVDNTDATVSWEGTVEGSCTATWEGDRGVSHTVGIQVNGADDISLVVGRFALGHFSAEELYEAYHFVLEKADEAEVVLQKAAAAAQAFNDTRDAVIEEVLNQSTVSWFTDRLAARTAPAPADPLTDLLPTDIDLTVDLSAYDPDATGTVQVTATGTSEGGLQGQVVYDPITVTCQTDVTYTYTDGTTTTTVTVAQGSQMTFALTVAWDVAEGTVVGLPDTDNWTVVATATGSTQGQSVDVTLEIEQDGETETYELGVATDTTRTFQIAAVDGVATYEASASGTWTVTWEDTNRRGQTVTRTVVIEITDMGEMYIVVNNLRLGPYTPAEAALKFVEILEDFDG